MKCFSLGQHGFFASAGIPGINGMGAYYIVDPYPRATLGLELDPDDRMLRIGFTQSIRASEELLLLPPTGNAIQRDYGMVSVLRASIEEDGDQTLLVPEQDDDTENALVHINVGSGPYQYVHYQTGDATVVKPASTGDETGHESLLVVLKPFESIVAIRSAKRWIFWGAVQVRETLTIRFDGQSIYYEVNRIRS